MPNYLTPGVYVEEVSSGAKPLEMGSTSVAGFWGSLKRDL
jgi:phage tail sheath protein FI